MSLLDRIRSIVAVRRTTDPRTPSTSRVYQSPRTKAGVTITPDTAIQVPAVLACVRYLSQTVGVLPWHVMRKTERGGEIYTRHPVDWLLHDRPHDEWSSMQFRETLTHWAVRWGNGYAEIERDLAGRPIALCPIHPSRVDPMRDEAGKLFYRVDGKVDLSAADVFHVRGFGEGVVGLSVIEYAAETIGWARAAAIFGAAFFGNGATPSGIVQSKVSLTPEGLLKLKAEFARLYGGPNRSNQTAVLDAGMEYKAISIEPDKAQFLQTNQHLVEEVCRIFGVPPHKVMHLLRATFSNIEHQSIEVVVDSIMPWALRFEQEANFKLFGANRSSFYTKFNFNGLLRGDSAARMGFYQGMRNIGVLNANEIRALEDLPTIGADGDKYVMQSGFTTLEKIGEDPPAPVAPSAADDPAEDDPADDGEDPADPQDGSQDQPEEIAARARVLARFRDMRVQAHPQTSLQETTADAV